MKKLTWVWSCGVLCVFMLVLACAPKVQPSPTVPPATPQPTPTVQQAPPQPSPVASQAAPQPSTSASDWDKVLATAGTEGKVVLYTTFGTQPWQEAVSKAIKEKYGIQMQFLQAGGAANFERIRTEDQSGQVVGDMYEGGFIPEMGPYAQPFEPPELSIAPQDVWSASPRFHDPTMRIISVEKPLAIGPTAVNTQSVKPGDEPKSYLDMLDPKWKGQMSLNDPSVPGEGSGVYTWIKQLYPDYWEKLAKQNPKIIRDYSQQALRVATGEDAMALGENAAALERYLAQGAPVKFLIPKEGILTTPHTMLITRHAPHPNAARVFVNFMLTQEGQATLPLMNLLPLRNDVKVTETNPEMQRLAEATPKALLTNEMRDIMSKQLADREPAKVFGIGQ